jgi:hypothetical protein
MTFDLLLPVSLIRTDGFLNLALPRRMNFNFTALFNRVPVRCIDSDTK